MTIYCRPTNYRKIYENNYGPIPREEDGRPYDVHHKDGNYKNNDPTNLTAIPIQEHYDIHYARGDWRGCNLIGIRMGITPELRSELSTKSANARVANGTHHFLKRADGSSIGSDISRKRISDGTSHFLNKENIEGYKKIRKENGSNPFLGGEVQRKSNSRRVENGTHNFIGSTENKKRVDAGTHNFTGPAANLKRLAEGSHPSQVPWQCDICGKFGKGVSNLKQHQRGSKCKNI